MLQESLLTSKRLLNQLIRILIKKLLLDEHLQQTKQLSHVKMKLNRATAILSKLKYNFNPGILKIMHHSLFVSHLLYACQLCSQKNPLYLSALVITGLA